MSDVFISGISHKINGHSLKKGLQLPCRSINIHHFSVQLIRGRNSPCAILTLPSKELADLFVICYGSSGPRSKPRLQLQIGSQNVYCRHSDKPTRDLLVVRSLVEQQNQAMKEHHKVLASAPRDTPASKKLTKSFPITGFELGTWATETLGGSTTVFNPRYLVRRAGTLHFRPQSVMIELEPVARPASGRSAEAQRYTLVMFYHQIYQVVTDSRNDVFLSLGTAPRIYINKKTDDPYLGEKLSRERISGIDEVHEGYSGFSFIYKVILKNGQAGDHSKVLRLGGTAGIPPVNPSFIITLPPKIDFIVAFEALMKRLQDPELGYRVAFQLHALMSNGIIPPESVLMILPRVRKLVQQVGRRVSAEILKAFVVDDFGAVGVQDDPTMASEQRLLQTLEERINMMKQYLTPRYFEDQEKKHESMAYVHKAMITPTGVFATGPFWEASNRVLREYSDFQDHFLRVSFCEEDGEQFMHEMRVTADRILQDKFLSRLDPTNEDGKIVIAGRKFQFLGFSNSSLKSQTCWYMAPFECNGRVINPKILIESLGDFSEIRTPGRYAARIGQAFSDTIGSAYVQAGSEIRIDDVERTDQFGKLRNFSDGIGKISMEMVQRIWKTSEQIELARPTVFQIRYAGAKGVICLDPNLRGDKLCLRKSMVKFEGSKARNIEICTWASRLPMFLNRPLIKLLEDLGVEDSTFLSLQRDAIQALRNSSKSAARAADFLRTRGVSAPCLRLPWLFVALRNLGMDFFDDPFLEHMLELSLLMNLRDIKYRGRIPIKKGLTLIGVLDETKFLGEGEVFVHFQNDAGKSMTIEGRVLITRSPVHHPGDVQMVNAVKVPAKSPLRLLQNCVVFSQQGDRPLPSMLAGGDLDGDLYNVVYDMRFNLLKNEVPAEYEFVKPVDLGRAVEASDVAKFFVDFIQNNLLGLISNKHLLIADQQRQGVFHPDCLILAEMASVAVDFPKTGIKVDRRAFPRCSKAKPDFFAPGPRVLISKDKVLHNPNQENDDDEDTVQSIWYASEKILGKLYREIDEAKFLHDIRREIRHEVGLHPPNLLERLWDHMQGETYYSQDWSDHIDFATELRSNYEDQMQYLMKIYSETPWKSRLSEVEVFVGSIIGREKSTKRQREMSMQMKDEYSCCAQYTIQQLKAESHEETLGKCMACLKICLPSFETPSHHNLCSFAWVAASVLVSEVDKMQETRVGEF